jgi:hypothetical protein
MLANRSILQLFRVAKLPPPTRCVITIGAIIGILFVVGYLFAVWVEGGTFFSGPPRAKGWCNWSLQRAEGWMNVAVMLVSGICVVFYFCAIRHLAAQNNLCSDLLSKINSIGYTPLLVVTLFTAAVGFIGIRFDSADRVTLVVVQIVVLAGSYLAVLACAKWLIPQA